MPTSRRCFVSGRVQGVAYRAAAQRRARELGVNGYARNLADGRVELLISGEVAAVDAVCAWLWQGSPHAEVSDVTCMDVEVNPSKGFTVE